MVTPTLLRPGEREEAAVVEAGENEGNNVNINDATVTKVVVANPAGEAPEGPGRAAPAPGSCTATEPATSGTLQMRISPWFWFSITTTVGMIG